MAGDAHDARGNGMGTGDTLGETAGSTAPSRRTHGSSGTGTHPRRNPPRCMRRPQDAGDRRFHSLRHARCRKAEEGAGLFCVGSVPVRCRAARPARMGEARHGGCGRGGDGKNWCGSSRWCHAHSLVRGSAHIVRPPFARLTEPRNFSLSKCSRAIGRMASSHVGRHLRYEDGFATARRGPSKGVCTVTPRPQYERFKWSAQPQKPHTATANDFS